MVKPSLSLSLATSCKVLGQSLSVSLGQMLGRGWVYGWLTLQRWLSLVLWSWGGALPLLVSLSSSHPPTAMEASTSAALWAEFPALQHVV